MHSAPTISTKGNMLIRGQSILEPRPQQSGPNNPYTPDLLKLESCTPLHATKIPVALAKINTPLRFPAWERALASHPDRDFVEYILTGIRCGFRIGFSHRSHACRPAKRNMQSAKELPHIVEEYLATEVEAGRLIGPLPPSSVPAAQMSPFGVIPKSQPGKWRLIVDLSSPEGHSVNEGINPEWCSLSYITVDVVASIVVQLGYGTQLAKLDIQSAYRIVPVHPHDRHLLGMRWEHMLYIDTALPFGLRSAPKIFNAVADALESIMISRGAAQVFHYLDDFIMVGPPGSPQCSTSLDTALAVCSDLGVPVAPHKIERPTTCLTFLGIEIDTVEMQLRLPPPKLGRLKDLLETWRGRKVCSKRELESLIGHLSHACKVVRPGRRFLRGMIALLSVAKRPSHHIRLNGHFRADLEWWATFLSPWNGVSMLYEVQRRNPHFEIWSDASGSWGCAAFWGRQWFQVEWANAATSRMPR